MSRAPVHRRVTTAVAILTLCASLLVACSSARTDIGTTDESCYLALPTAAKAVGGHAHFEGVRKYSLNGMKGVAPRLYGHLAKDVPKGKSVCLAAYSGHFTSDSVDKPLGRSAGKLAVVVVAVPGNRLLGTLILEKLPVRFQHLF
ncbi:MAG TPA: hypothetical protein VHD39_05115 [Acidimicrobiales bacterium]|nr:hypothetical protein [Acidimicrobiales bacterium]